MKALVVAPQPFFSPRGTPLSVYYRTLISAELGLEIDLLTYGEGEDVDIPGVRIIRIPRFGFFGDVKVGPSFLKLFLDIFVMFWTIGLLLFNRYDFVHAHEEAAFFCRFLKPIFRFKLLYDMHSRLPQQLTNFQFTSSLCMISLFNKLENSCLHAADAIITICPDLADFVERTIHDKNKHVLIENSIFDAVRVAGRTTDLREYVSEDVVALPFVPFERQFVVYAGTLEPYQGIDTLISAFSTVITEIPNAFLIIVGGDENQVKSYSDLAERSGLGDNVLFTGRVSQALAKHYSSLASVLMSPRIEGTNTPLKIYEQIASGIPLVATNIYSHTQALNDDVAFLTEPKPDEMGAGIIEALTCDEKRSRIVKNARDLYEEKYSRAAYKRKMQTVLEFLS